MNENYLKPFIRKVTKEDKEKLPTYSYSRLEVFRNCPLRYYKENIENKRVDEDTLPLTLGSICHKVLEEKGKIIQKKNTVTLADYSYLRNILMNGADEVDKSHKKHIMGVNEIQERFFEDWGTPDKDTGLTYDDKMDTFDKAVHLAMEDNIEMDYQMWYPYKFEEYFEFVWKDKCIFHGYIDRLDKHRDGSIRTIDYKTSRKIYDRDKLVTSLQFGIYALAVLLEYGILPKQSIYNFVLLKETQTALTFGWEKRLEKILDTTIQQIQEMVDSKIAKPKPSGLCYWCSYSKTNPNAKQYKNDCEYHSLWKPNNKTYRVNKEWSIEQASKPKRKLTF